MAGNREMLRLAEGYDGKMPHRKFMPAKTRVPEKIPLAAGNAIKRCTIGEKPWPLSLLGAHGAGKTCAALCLLDRYGGLYWTVDEWAERMREAMLGRLQTYHCGRGCQITLSDVRNEWTGANLCVLDEIGLAGRASDHETKVLHWAIDQREGRPLILISNRPLEELGQLYEGGLPSRMMLGTRVWLTEDQRMVKCEQDM